MERMEWFWKTEYSLKTTTHATWELGNEQNLDEAGGDEQETVSLLD